MFCGGVQIREGSPNPLADLDRGVQIRGGSKSAVTPVQTSNFPCAESNANEKNLLFSLICIRFGTCKVRRLNRALNTST